MGLIGRIGHIATGLEITMSKKKIGFIDYFIDEWHANNYPGMIREGAFKDKFEIALAWDKITKDGHRTLDVWCKELNVPQAKSIEQVVEESDCIVVLSPDNVEMHEELADLPLRSGKPVYVDKPFAPTLAAGQRMFAKAAEHNTPLMSSSALRYGSALENVLKDTIGDQKVNFVSVRGGGVFHIYAIHQLEMLVMALGTGACRVMQCGNKESQLLLIDYPDGRRGSINLMYANPFGMGIHYGENQSLNIDTMDDFFPRFIDAMLTFFETGVSSAPREQTLEIAALIEAGTAALATPDQWVSVPK